MRSWVADELKVGADPLGLDVHQDYGFDVPSNPERAAWWMPAPHAARLLAAGAPVKLLSPRADLLSLLPERFLGRSVQTCTLEEAGFTRPGWFKAADVKNDDLPAAFYEPDVFLTAARRILEPSSMVQFTETTLDILVEYRFYVNHGEVTTGSAYLSEGVTYYDGLVTSEGFTRCEDFARDVLGFLQAESLAPLSFVIDVALPPSGPVVLEFNPSWCAGFYGADVTEVVKALVTAADPSNLEHIWVPDAYYQARANRMRPLR